MSIHHQGVFGDHFDNQKDEQFPSRFRKQDYSSPKFVQQQKLKSSGSASKVQQLMDASLFKYDSPKSQLDSSHSNLQFETQPNIIKSQSVNQIKNKQFIVFPKIQQSIRNQQQQERNNLFLQYASTPHGNLMQDKSISAENVKKIRKISPETKTDHVCKKSVIIPYQQGKYTMSGLPNSNNRTKKLTNLSFTKMQWNITKYDLNFALSKKEQEIREFLKVNMIKKLSTEQGKDTQNTLLTITNQGNKSTTNQQTEFNFFTSYSRSPKSDKNTPSLMQSPNKQTKQTHQ